MQQWSFHPSSTFWTLGSIICCTFFLQIQDIMAQAQAAISERMRALNLPPVPPAAPPRLAEVAPSLPPPPSPLGANDGASRFAELQVTWICFYLYMVYYTFLFVYGILYLFYHLLLNHCNIFAIWKQAIIRKPAYPQTRKPADLGSSYSPISLLCPAVTVLERLLHPELNSFFPSSFHLCFQILPVRQSTCGSSCIRYTDDLHGFLFQL